MTRVSTIIEGEYLVHMAGGVSDYDTSCGLDMNDPAIGQTSDNISETRDKINCPACIRIWLSAREYRKSDFEAGTLARVHVK
jgi:hypothetical protein